MKQDRPLCFTLCFLQQAPRGLFSRSLLFTVLILAPASWLLPSAFAQSATATLSGSVVDQNGAVIPGAMVTLENTATGLNRKATTNNEGTFTFPLLAPGTYTVRAENQGFAPLEVQNVVLNVGDNKSLQIPLKAGSISEMVKITSDAPLINESPAVGTVVDRQFVENLPLNGRTFQNLIALSPGVVLVKANFNNQGQFSVNGQRADANYFTVDGVSANAGVIAGGAGPGFSGAGVLPALNAAGGTSNLVSVDAMQEFKIQTSTYAPEFGRTPGGQIQIVTRSGTNLFSGTLYEYFRNEALDANDWFANSQRLRKPALRQNNFGGVFGGPILKNRTFFFFSYEGLRLRLPTTRITTVPSLNARQTASASTRPYIEAYSVPNGRDFGNNTAEFIASYSDPSSSNATSIRVDHKFNEKVFLFGRFSVAPSYTTSRGTPASTYTSTEHKSNTLTAGLTWVIRPTVDNDFRVNWSRNVGTSIVDVDNFGGAVRPSDSLLFPYSTPSTSFLGFSIPSLGQLSFGLSGENVQKQINLVDSLSIVKENHQLKIGIDYRRLSPTRAARESVIIANFSNLASALAGRASSIAVQAGKEVGVRVHNLSIYGQDTWRARQNLTLTYGLRWELNPPPKGTDGDVLLTAVGIDNPTSISLAPAGTPFYSTSYGNIAPRFGLSYVLFDRPGRETILRGGAGIFYDLGYGVSANPGFPFVVGKTLSNFDFPLSQTDATPPPFDPNAPVIGFIVAFDPDLQLPRTYQWNVAVEQSLGSNQTVSATYVAALGRKLLQQRFIRFPNARFTGVSATDNSAESDYHSLQLQFNRRVSKGTQALASYSWSHSIDTFSSNDFDTASGARGPSDFDVRHAFNAAITFDIPSLKAQFLEVLSRNWSLDTIFYARSATPVDLFARTSNILGFANTHIRPDLVAGQPLYIQDPAAAGGRRFNPDAFRIPPTGRQGTLGRNVLRGFSIWQADIALRRKISITERVNVQFKAEIFNVFNHPNFADPAAFQGNFLTSSLFGRSTSMLARGLGSGGLNGGLNPLYQIGGPRSIQLVFKLNF